MKRLKEIHYLTETLRKIFKLNNLQSTVWLTLLLCNIITFSRNSLQFDLEYF